MRGTENLHACIHPQPKPLSSGPSRLTPPLPVIRGFLETSFLDWPGRLCSIFFLGGCNFRCPFCHNHPLVLAPETLNPLSVQEVLAHLAPFRRWLGGICISGGEPTLSPGLPAMIAHLKAEGWAVKLDTNGSRPHLLERLVAEKLVDMVAMDVKAPLVQEKYDRCAGIPVDLQALKESIRLLQRSGVAHEFRMTVLPRFHSREDIERWIAELGPGAHLTLQNFKPATTLDPGFARETGFHPDAFEKLKKMTRP